ncbi:MAG: type III-A CRISPR-associated RAMP protein Csm4 [Ignavibacteriaceae bacterium]|nr:type III-A CRISPR-associated RAMP protein Csm4 [Ignavibacteriaceae bacterium]
MKAYKLKFHSSFHLDSGDAVDGPSELFLRSDTLFSAICSAANKFYGNSVVESFLQPNSIKISSAYPYYKDEFFFPKPLNFYPDEIEKLDSLNLIEKYDLLKEFKKVKFISKVLLEILLQGKEKRQSIDKSYFSQDFILNTCWRTIKNITPENKKEGQEEDKIFKVNEIPHIVMDRITNQTQIFYKTEVYFNKNAGLFFLAEINKDLLAKFETVLRFLGDEGIGADRTIGKGLFEIEVIDNFSITAAEKFDSFYSLSLYSPIEEEFYKIESEKSFYEFDVRKGWVSNNTLRRKSLRMFTEGSILKFKEEIAPNGVIHKLLEKEKYPKDLSNDIFRSGQALFLPIVGGSNGTN